VQLLRNGSIVEGRREQALATIERSAQSQMRLIDDLLDMARIIAGKLQLELHPTDLFWIIQEAIETVQVAAAAKKIELVVDGHRGDAIAYCDPGRMLQVICNLLSNAIKFTPANGRISVSLTTAENWATTKIADTGVGIAPELLPTVFERFRQGDSIRRDRQSGLGLGLALALELVERQGGTLTAESAGNGLGATFTVRMSLAEPPVRPVA
jgi:signal transduction histidine kinase